MRKPHTYWDEGIQLIDGCSPCSPGCLHCWSAAFKHRFDIEGDPGHENHILTMNDKPVFNGVVITYPERLKRFNTRKPKVFAIWNDTFHLSVPFEFIDEFHKVNMNNLHNTVLILTKRPERMKLYYQGRAHWENEPNIYKGLTVCNQQEMEEKSETFFSVPGNKFLSLEPLLSKVIIPPWVIEKRLLSVVILGAETGIKARPMSLDWARSIAEQCNAAGVPLFIKALTINGKPNHNIEEFPEDLRIRELVW